MSEGVRWRIWVHALDRTGPPVLARTFARWLRRAHPDDRLEVLAFRGGPVVAELADLGPVTVVLDDEEPWDHSQPDPVRVQALRHRLASLEPVDVNLLVSTSAGQPLPLVGRALGPIVSWSVEMGDDLHWLDDDIGLLERSDVWLAGSRTTALELERWIPGPVPVVPEFVDQHRPASTEAVEEVRSRLGLGAGAQVVLGIGIGTYRKGIDLFVEVAAALRDAAPEAHLVWLGGERDPNHPLARDDIARLGLGSITLYPSVPDLAPWLGLASVLVHPARVDAFPLVCLHAAAAGVPVVAFAGTGGVEEMFGPAFLGAPYPDVAALAGIVRDLLHDGARPAAAAQHDQIAHRHLVPDAAAVLRAAVLDRVAVAGGRS